MTKSPSFYLVVCSIVIGACTSGAEERVERDVGSIQQPIYNGTPYTAGLITNLVDVWSTHNGHDLGTCSGVALDSEWVLTAAHCGNGYDGNYIVPDVTHFRNAGSQEQVPVREWIQHPSLDFALARIYPFRQASVAALALWNASLTGLLNRTLLCIGQGANATGCGPLDSCGAGTWRYSYLVPAAVAGFPLGQPTSSVTFISPYSGTNLQLSGDSGSPCIAFDNNVLKIAGITSLGSTDASFSQQVGLDPDVTAWATSQRNRSMMLFYRGSDGYAFLSSLEADGTYKSDVQLTGFAMGASAWTKVTVLRNGFVLFYNSNNGAAAYAHLNKDGTYDGSDSLPDGTMPAGMTHVVSVGPDRIFMYNSATGDARTARLRSAVGGSGVLLFPRQAEFTSGQTLSGFAHGSIDAWTHIVGTADGTLFFYKQGAGTAYTSIVDANLQYSSVGSFTGFSKTWDYVTSVNEREVFFYNSANATGFTAQITAAGGYSPQVYLTSGLPLGNSVVGATNGALIFRDANGGGRTAKISASGAFTSVSTSLSGFATNWTHLAME